jgi:hypothetical protein
VGRVADGSARRLPPVRCSVPQSHPAPGSRRAPSSIWWYLSARSPWYHRLPVNAVRRSRRRAECRRIPGGERSGVLQQRREGSRACQNPHSGRGEQVTPSPTPRSLGSKMVDSPRCAGMALPAAKKLMRQAGFKDVQFSRWCQPQRRRLRDLQQPTRGCPGTQGLNGPSCTRSELWLCRPQHRGRSQPTSTSR